MDGKICSLILKTPYITFAVVLYCFLWFPIDISNRPHFTDTHWDLSYLPFVKSFLLNLIMDLYMFLLYLNIKHVYQK